MSTITPTFYVDKVYVQQYQGCPNSVARVRWLCEMSRGGVKIYGGGETYLNPPSPYGFIPISQLTAAQVLDWVIDVNGGQAWVDVYVSDHEDAMQRAERNAQMQIWPNPLIDQPPTPTPTN
jgi:hypothetical protein